MSGRVSQLAALCAHPKSECLLGGTRTPAGETLQLPMRDLVRNTMGCEGPHLNTTTDPHGNPDGKNQVNIDAITQIQIELVVVFWPSKP